MVFGKFLRFGGSYFFCLVVIMASVLIAVVFAWVVGCSGLFVGHVLVGFG